MSESKRNDTTLWILTGFMFLLLFFLGKSMYLLFHSIAELVAITVAWAVFLLGWNTRKETTSRAYLVLGIGYLFVGALDLLHTLAYEGMNVIPRAAADEATQLWMAARFTEVLSIGAYPLFITRSVWEGPVFLFFGGLFAMIIASIIIWPVFPACFIPGEGLTAFKVAGEYVIIFLLCAAGVCLVRKRGVIDPQVLRLFLISISLTVLSEGAFILYSHPYGIANMIGHLLKILSFLFIYKALLVEGLTRPLDSLFRDLNKSKERVERRDNILSALNRATRGFLVTESETDIEKGLEEIGRAVEVQRVYIFENQKGPGGELLTSQVYEWAAPGTVSQRDNPLLQNASYEDLDFIRWETLLSAGKPVHGGVREFPGGERAFLEEQGIISVAIIPIFVAGSWWGFMGFDDCKTRRLWSEAELGALYTAGELFSAFILKRRYQEELHAKEARYRALFELSKDGIFVSDRMGNLIDVNRQACVLLGYTREELLSMDVEDCHAPDTREDAYRALESLKQTDFYQFETVLRSKKRKRIDVEVTTGILDAGAELYQAIIQDIGERKHLERRLLEASEIEGGRLGRELHDGLCQELKGLEIQAALLRNSAPEMKALEEGINRALKGAYGAVKGLIPQGFGPPGFKGTLMTLADEIKEKGSEWGTEVHVECFDEAIPLREKESYQLYMICREAVYNAFNHGKPKKITVRLEMKESKPSLSVRDDGIGITTSFKRNRGMGIAVMRARADLLAAKLTVKRRDSGGTEVLCESHGTIWGRNDNG